MLSGNEHIFFIIAVNADGPNTGGTVIGAFGVKDDAASVGRPIRVRVFPKAAGTDEISSIQRGISQIAIGMRRRAARVRAVCAASFAPTAKGQTLSIRRQGRLADVVEGIDAPRCLTLS